MIYFSTRSIVQNGDKVDEEFHVTLMLEVLASEGKVCVANSYLIND